MEGETGAPNRLRQARTLLWVIVAIALVAAAALFLIPRNPDGATEAGAGLGAPFTLMSADSKPFPSSRLEGEPYAIFFGFTHCPDVCPTTLARLARLRQSAGGEKAFNIVFVSIDPERDGPKEMGEYAKMFETPILALTGDRRLGDPELVDAIADRLDALPHGVVPELGDVPLAHGEGEAPGRLVPLADVEGAELAGHRQRVVPAGDVRQLDHDAAESCAGDSLDAHALALEAALEILGGPLGLGADVLVDLHPEDQVDAALQVEPQIDRLARRVQVPEGDGEHHRH